MRLATGFLVCTLAAFAVGSAADASSFSATNGKLVYAVGGKHPARIVASNADGSTPKQLTKPASNGDDLAPHVSADGKEVVFSRRVKKIWQIVTVGIRGGRAHTVKISGLPKRTSTFAPTFTPNGKTIIFEVDNKNDDAVGIWSVPAKGGKARPLLKGPYGGPAVSPDGKHLAFYTSSMDDFGKIKTATITGKNVQTVFDWTNAGAGTFALDPDFSPDGTQLAIELLGSGSSGDTFSSISLIPVAGGDPTDLVISPLREEYFLPAFSPDGTTVAFVHKTDGNGIGTSEIDSVPAGGGSASVLVPAASGLRFIGLDWQPKR